MPTRHASIATPFCHGVATRVALWTLAFAAAISLPAPEVAAQALLQEAPLGLGYFGTNTRKIDTGRLAGDSRRDLLLLRDPVTSTSFRAEVWERTDGSPSGFARLPLYDYVVDAIPLDIDSDGDDDILKISGQEGALSVLRNSPAGFMPDFILAFRPGAYFLRPYFFAMPPAPSIVGVLMLHGQGPGQGRVSFLYRNGSTWAQYGSDIVHPGGAGSVSDGFGLAGPASGNYVLTLGEPPQRLWRGENGAFTLVADLPINRYVVRALKIDFNADDFVDLVTVSSEGQVDAWLNLGGRPGHAIGDVEWLGELGSPSDGVVTALEFVFAPGPGEPADIVVGRGLAGLRGTTYRTDIFAIDPVTLDVVSRPQQLTDARALEYEAFSGTLYTGGNGGIRAYTRAPAVLPSGPAIGFMDLNGAVGFRILQGKGGRLPLRATGPLPQSFTLVGDSATTTYTAELRQGDLTGELIVPEGSPDTASTGAFQITLRAPTGAGTGLTADFVATVNVMSDIQARCMTTCVMNNCAGGSRALRGKQTVMGTEAELQTLRDLRDQVLAASPKGSDYIDYHDRFGPELLRLTYLRPTFYGDLWDAKTAWMPAIESLVNGDGSLVVTQTMVDTMERVFDHYESNASFELAVTIRAELDALQPANFVGQPIGALKEAWAALPPVEVFGSGFEP